MDSHPMPLLLPVLDKCKGLLTVYLQVLYLGCFPVMQVIYKSVSVKSCPMMKDKGSGWKGKKCRHLVSTSPPCLLREEVKDIQVAWSSKVPDEFGCPVSNEFPAPKAMPNTSTPMLSLEEVEVSICHSFTALTLYCSEWWSTRLYCTSREKRFHVCHQDCICFSEQLAFLVWLKDCVRRRNESSVQNMSINIPVSSGDRRTELRFCFLVLANFEKTSSIKPEPSASSPSGLQMYKGKGKVSLTLVCISLGECSGNDYSFYFFLLSVLSGYSCPFLLCVKIVTYTKSSLEGLNRMAPSRMPAGRALMCSCLSDLSQSFTELDLTTSLGI